MHGWIAAGIAGLCLGLAPMNTWTGHLMWLVALVALGRTPRGAPAADIARGAVVGLLWYGLSLRWVALQWVDLDGSLTLPMLSWAGVTLVQASVPAVGSGLAGALLQRGWPRHVALPVAWVAAAGLAPWVQPLPGGLAVYGSGVQALLWPAAWLGLPGFVALAGTVSAYLGRRPAIGLPLLAVWAAIGGFPAPASGVVLRVGVVQPNTGAFDARRPSTAEARTERLVRLVHEADAAGAEIIATPETAWPHALDLRRRSAHDALASAFSDVGTVILGAAIIDAEPPTNSLLHIERGQVRGRQDKIHLVPVSERRLLGLGRDVFRPGVDRRLLGHGLAGVICYEDLVPAGLRGLGSATWIVAASNDAWLGPGPGSAQHHGAARLGAVRSGRWLVRPTANGALGGLRSCGTRGVGGSGRFDGDRSFEPGLQAVVTIRPRRPMWSGADVEPWLGLLFALLAGSLMGLRGPISQARHRN